MRRIDTSITQPQGIQDDPLAILMIEFVDTETENGDLGRYKNGCDQSISLTPRSGQEGFLQVLRVNSGVR